MPRRTRYRRRTAKPLPSLAFILPMLVFFHVCTAVYGTNLLAPRDLHKLLRYFGATAAWLPALLVIIVLMLQHVLQRDRWKLGWRLMGGMAGESVLWTLPLLAMMYVTGRALPHQAAEAPQADALIAKLAQACGAGIYEEFIFRLVAISLLLLILVDILSLKREPSVVAAVVIGAVTFSLYHFSGAQLSDGSTFPWGAFVFRTAAGLYLGALFVYRGYGIAVGTHVFYDVYVLLIAGNGS